MHPVTLQGCCNVQLPTRGVNGQAAGLRCVVTFPSTKEALVPPHPRASRRVLASTLCCIVLGATAIGCLPVATLHNIFGASVPTTKTTSDTASVELGMRFRAAAAGQVVGVRFYKGAGNTGTHTGHLWTRTGTLLATVTFTNETATGWQSATFPQPVSVVAGTTYVISYHAPSGHYAADLNYFATARTNGPLTALADGTDGPSGSYRYGTVAFPNTAFQKTNYWVDPVVTTSSTPTTTTTASTSSTSTTSTTKPPTTTTTAPTTTTTTTPPLTGFPTPATTGWAPTGVTLTAYSGPSTITVANTVIDSKDIASCLSVQAKNVTIKRSRIRCVGDFGIQQTGSASGLLVQDVEITSGTGGMLDRAIIFNDGATMQRAYIHHMQRGIAVGNNTTIERSYVGENQNGTDAHTSAIMTSGGTSHVIVRQNTLQTVPDTNASSAISFYPELWAGGANTDFLIDGNLLNSGGEYAVYLGHTPSAGESPNTNFRFVNNRFGTLYFPLCGNSGPVASWSNVAGNTWSNNTWYDLRPTGGGYTNKNGQTVNF